MPSLPRCPDPGRSQHLHQLLTPGVRGDGPTVWRAARPGRAHQLRLVAGPGLGLLRLGGAQRCALAHSCPVPQPAPTPRNAPICGHLSPSVAGWWGAGRLRHPWRLLESWQEGTTGMACWGSAHLHSSWTGQGQTGQTKSHVSSHELSMAQSWWVPQDPGYPGGTLALRGVSHSSSWELRHSPILGQELAEGFHTAPAPSLSHGNHSPPVTEWETEARKPKNRQQIPLTLQFGRIPWILSCSLSQGEADGRRLRAEGGRYNLGSFSSHQVGHL